MSLPEKDMLRGSLGPAEKRFSESHFASRPSSHSLYTNRPYKTFKMRQHGLSILKYGFKRRSRSLRLIDELHSTEFNLWKWSRSEIHVAILTMFERCDVLKTIDIRRSKLLKCIKDIEQGYFGNVYHSFLHAVDVLQMCYFLVTVCHGGEVFGLSNYDIFVLFLAALAHDIGHPGLNNVYHIKANTDLAKRYHNDAILENYAYTLLLRIMNKHGILDELDSTIRDSILENLRQTILYTDMERHFSLLEEMKNVRHSTPSTSLILRVLLHAADISNPCRPWKLAMRWSECVVEEFFNQGILEKIHGYSISPNMDRNTVSQVQMSLGFVDSTVLPFFEELMYILPKSRVLFEELVKNRSTWQTLNANHSNVFLGLSDDSVALHKHQLRPSSSFDFLETSSSLEDIISTSQDLVFGRHHYHRGSAIEKQGSFPDVVNALPSRTGSSLINEDIDGIDIEPSKLRRRWSIQPSHSETHLSCRRSSIVSSLSSSLLSHDDYLGK